MQTLSSDEVTFAGFWVRLAAFIIDSAVIGVGLLAVRVILAVLMTLLKGTPLEGSLLFHYTIKDMVLYALGVLYYILCTYFTGTTLGKRVMNLRVIYKGEQEQMPFFTVFYRETIGKFLNGFIPLIGALVITLDKEKRGVHDILCDTRVIYAKKIKVYPSISKTQPQPLPPYIAGVSKNEVVNPD